ncbi:hypothetical protein [Subtercola vilae]|uniref:Uncharacterized protein n=1 Tax=Subtercola vilae TaxID=2056433 RepID=A0A4T2BE40_9MICO|nr:hypothetical protein [Subtercola vilae]TIH29653.1 hypothetical protein D4765_17785 [Subtercola vilae]
MSPTTSARPNRLRRAAIAASLGLAAMTSLSACGVAPWQVSASGVPSASDASAAPSATPAPQATITPIVNDLATGTAQHLLQAGDIALTVNYFSTLSMDKWQASANKPVSFNMIGVLGSDQGQRIYLSRVSLSPAVTDRDGKALAAPATLSDQATVAPGYFIKSPYSYSETFVLPPVDPAATEITLQFTFELLLQTTPTSSDYSKQTATDTITVAIAK